MKHLPSIALVRLLFLAFWLLLLSSSIPFKASARLFGWPRWDDFRLEENRNLATFPDLRRTPARDWGSGLDAWYNDSFAFRSRIVQFYRWLHTDILASPISDIEIPGTDGWMYRNGSTWREIDDYLGVFELTPAEIARWLEFLEGRVEWASAHGTAYLEAITPVKAQIHPEHLPPAVRRHPGQGVREQLRAALENSPVRTNVLFLTDAIRDITDRGGRTYFYPSDHHVNGYGCYVLYREIMDASARILGIPSEPPPWYDDPPPAVRDNLEWGCFQCGDVNYERLAVRMPGMTPVHTGAYPDNQAEPRNNITFQMPGHDRRTIAIAHDSFLRFPMYSWYHNDVEPVRIPLSTGFDRAVSYMFNRFTTGRLLNLTAHEKPAVIVEQIPEIRLGERIIGLDETIRRAAVFSRGTPITAEEAALLPPDTPLCVRVLFRDLPPFPGFTSDTPVPVELLSSGTPVATEYAYPAPVRAIYYPPLPLGGHSISLSLPPELPSGIPPPVIDLRLFSP